MRAFRFWGCTIGNIILKVHIRNVRSENAFVIIRYVQRIPLWEIKCFEELPGHVARDIANLVSYFVELVGGIVKSICAAAGAVITEAVQDIVVNAAYNIETRVDGLTRFKNEGFFFTEKVPSEVRSVNLRFPLINTVSGQATYG